MSSQLPEKINYFTGGMSIIIHSSTGMNLHLPYTHDQKGTITSLVKIITAYNESTGKLRELLYEDFVTIVQDLMGNNSH